MKQQLNRLQGMTVTISNQKYTFKDYLHKETGFDWVYLSLSPSHYVVKVYHLGSSVSTLRFHNERHHLENQSIKSLPSSTIIEEFKISNQSYGLFAFKQSFQGHLLSELGKKMTELQWLVKSALQLKNNKMVFCNFHPNNIYRSNSGHYTLMNSQLIQNQGYQPQCSFQTCDKEFRYISPEFLDPYQTQTIDYTSDLFSIGCLLYELKYGCYPFESQYAVLTLNPIKQNDSSYLANIINKLIAKKKVRQLLNLNKILIQLGKIIEDLKEDERKQLNENKSSNKSSTTTPTQNSEFNSKQSRDSFDVKKQSFTGSSSNIFEELYYGKQLKKNTKRKQALKKRNSISFEEFGKLMGNKQLEKKNKKLQQRQEQFKMFHSPAKINNENVQKQNNAYDLEKLRKQISKAPSFDTKNPFKPILELESKKDRQMLKQLQLKELKTLLQKNRDLIINYEDLSFVKEIGSGSAGQVFLGTYNQQQIAIKKVKASQNPTAMKEFERQLITLIKTKHSSNLVNLIGLAHHKGQFYLLTEYCQYGSLFDVLHKKVNDIQLTWKQKTEFCLQVAEGMKNLHQMNPIIIHRDLKSLNIFVTKKQGKWKLKVADFGLSRSPDAGMMTTQLGTIHWMAPQLLESKQYSKKVDVYSFGILLWEILARKTPYSHLKSPMGILKHVVIDKQRPSLESISKECPQELLELMKQCWSAEGEERPDFLEICGRLKCLLKNL